MKTQITYDEYLTAKGLFHLAAEAFHKATEYESALGALLGSDESYLHHLSDEIVNYPGSLDDGLEKIGITVIPKD